jgi:glycosyltransferase involved in cell wall biosynthesis
MRIGIDVRYLSHGLVGGVHTYVSHLIPALLDLKSPHQLFLYADSKRRFELSSLPPNVFLRTLPWRTPLSSVYQDLTLHRWMAADQLDVAHFPANYGFAPRHVRTVLTLHDSINIQPLYEIVRGHPKNPRTLALMVYLHLCSTAALRRADLVLTDSRYAATDIARHGKTDRNQIVPIPLAPAPDIERVTSASVLAEVRQRHDLPMHFVLADAIKNPAVLVRAWRQLPESVQHERRIVFFSRTSTPPPIVHNAVRSGDAQLLIGVSRSDLIALYSMADAFVFPSWIEGFGIPVLEAMTCGAPVIASDRASIPEVVGDAGIYIDAEDAPGLAQHLTAVLTQPDLAARLRQQGFERAGGFSWRNTAQQTLSAYELMAA